MDQTHALGNEKVGLLIKRFYWPAFVSVFVSALYNIVDRIFIGQGVGAAALSGLSIIFPIMLIMMAFGMLFGVGTGVQVSISLGEKDQVKAEKTLGNGFSLMLLVSVFITVLTMLIKDPLLRVFGASDDTIGYAQDYLMIILPGVIFQVVGFSLNNVIRSEGNAKVAMYSMLIGAGINIVLDPIFIFVLDMGVKGAAFATLISMMMMSVWVLSHFIRRRSVVDLHYKYMRLEFPVVKAIVAIGMAPFAMQLAASVVHALFNLQLVRFGNDIAVAANGILMSVMSMIFMCVVAVNMATQPIIGYNYGAKNFDRVKQTLFKGIKIASLIAVAGFILVEVFPGAIVRMFNNTDEELYHIGVRGIRIGLAMTALVGFQVVVGNYFQSTGKARLAMIISLLRQVIVLTPLLMIFPRFLGLDGVWLSMPVSGFVSALIVAWYFRKELVRLNELIDSQEKLL
ncbi:MATE family efflux transporter [Roseimarinus sediminis]|jgi:putative MATE family efflux protein|uniref:MATE family efflux transporter n=1 Tax=Roseimarinus sediminis TaxID=1610899 RepID=UPI003D1F1DE5